MIPDEIILDMHRETKEQTKLLNNLDKTLTVHISETNVRLEGYDDRFEAVGKRLRINRSLWILLAVAIVNGATWYYNIPVGKAIASFIGVGVGGWLVKETIS